MSQFFQKLTFTAVIDILAVAALIYNFVLVLRGRRAMHVLSGIAVLAILYGGSVLFHLDLLRTVLAAMAPYTAIAIIVIFQSEIRRALARLGRIRGFGLGGQLERREMVDEIVLAAQELADTKTGALIVLERDIGLRTFIESGIALDANLSRDLLCAIFQPGGPLHDGAVIVQGDRIVAAACFLPLATSAHAPRSNKHGTRHLAALGVTEESDAIAVVISEETGGIGVAHRAELQTRVDAETLRSLLIGYTAGKASRGDREPEPEWKRAL